MSARARPLQRRESGRHIRDSDRKEYSVKRKWPYVGDHFASIGFTIRSDADINGLTSRAHAAGRIIASAHGRYLVWSPGEGIELWFGFDRGNRLLGLEPYFGGVGGVRIGFEGVVRGPPRYSDTEGGAYGWANPTPQDPRKGDCPLVIDLPDFDLNLARFRPGEILLLRVAGFAESLACFSTDAEFEAVPRTARYSPEYFIPIGLFVEGRGQPGATARFAGHVLRTRVARNPVTQRPFRHLVVKTLVGTIDVVADPGIVQGNPIRGGVVEGSFWLTGRILEEGFPPPPPDE